MSGPELTLRPYSSLFRQGLISCVVFMAPVFVVLYVLTIPTGPWQAVVAIQVVAIGLAGLAAAAFFRTAVWVEPGGIRERGFFGKTTTVDRAAIGSIVLAETFTGNGVETRPQLFICDDNGRQLVRLRGQFWSRESMEVVISTLDVPVSRLTDLVTIGDLRVDFPGLLYWFERHRILAVLVFTAASAALAALVVLVLSLMGVPLLGLSGR